ncbi:MAG: branched-chain amino acid ABC transporter ATP-binding protein/permease, partial [Actinobacteria bacterium]|nr:branched-chain amino acid ABC transporter ATP-binding protein/permease [Actinomycetota bacterium]
LAGGAGTKPLQRTFTDFLIAAMIVVSLQMFVGNSGIVSFGHMAFVGIGAYTAALVTISPVIKEQALPAAPGWLQRIELGFVPSVLLATAIAAVVAAVVGGAMARMREMAMAMATLALLVLVHTTFANWDSVTRGGYGIYGVPENTSLWVALGALVVLVLVARLYRESRPGLRLQATREDPLPARALGVNVVATRFGGWVLSAAAMGAAGALFAQHLLAFDPDQFYFALTFTTLAMLVVGGRASVSGAVAGAGLVTAVSDLLRRAELGFRIGPLEVPELTGLTQLSVAVLIILVLVFRPTGVFGRSELEEVVARWRARLSPRPQVSPVDLEASAKAVARPAAAAGPGGPPVLRAEGVTMDFQGLRALAGVTLALAPGEILGLIGPNGSGKTTLVNVVSGIYAPTGGRVFLGEVDVTGWPAHRIAHLGVSRTFQNIRLFAGLTVRENVQAAATAGAGEDDVDRVLDWFDLGSNASDLAGTLAYGVQRRVEIARAVIRRPSVLMLDEPAAGMNEAESEELLETISRVREDLECSVVVIDHDLRLILRLCHRVQVLNEGQTIAEGRPDRIAADPKVVEAYLGTERPAV